MNNETGLGPLYFSVSHFNAITLIIKNIKTLITINICSAMLGGLRRFDAPRELSFLLRIDRCFASQSNDLDGLASSIKRDA